MSVDRSGTDRSPQRCDNCQATKPNRYDWITHRVVDVEVSGTWCSWSCYNAWFNVAWSDKNQDLPKEDGEL